MLFTLVILILLSIVISILSFIFSMYVRLATSGTLLVAFSADLLAIFFIAAWYAHQSFSINIVTGFGVYFWDAVAGVLATVLYLGILFLLYRFIPILCKIVNYIISFLATLSAAAFVVVVVGTFARFFVSLPPVGVRLPLLNDALLNEIANYVVYGMLAIPVYRRRVELMDDYFGDYVPIDPEVLRQLHEAQERQNAHNHPQRDRVVEHIKIIEVVERERKEATPVMDAEFTEEND